MIFLRRESFKEYLKRYPGIVAIGVICVAYYLFTFFGGYLKSSMGLYNAGALITLPGIDPFGFTEPWRYLTSMFMHAGFYHLFHNMFMLIVFAPPLERLMKTKRFVPFYILCGLGGSLMASLLFSAQGEPAISVGASGAVYGILGAYLFMALFRQRMLDVQSKNTIYMILGIGVVTSLMISNINLWAHLGGLLTGLLLYRLFEQLHFKK